MLETINETSSFLDGFEEQESQIINDGTDDGIETINTLDGIETDDTFVPPVEEKEEEKENQEESEEEESDDEVPAFSYKAFLSHLSDEGLVAFEDKEDIPDNVDVVYESVKKTIETGINQYKESIPEQGRQFLEYLEKGGDVNKYLETLQKPLDLNTLDLDSEADQERVLTEYLKLQNYTTEEIKETVTDYKDGLILDKQSKIAAKQLEKAFEKQTEILLKNQELQAEAQKEQYNQYIHTVSNTIDSSESLAGLDVTKAEKDAFRKYLLVRGKDGLTDYEREYQADPVKIQLELAYLKYKKYDFSSAKKAGATALTKKLNWTLKNNETTVKGGKSSSDPKEESNFDAFKSFIPKRK